MDRNKVVDNFIKKLKVQYKKELARSNAELRGSILSLNIDNVISCSYEIIKLEMIKTCFIDSKDIYDKTHINGEYIVGADTLSYIDYEEYPFIHKLLNSVHLSSCYLSSEDFEQAYNCFEQCILRNKKEGKIQRNRSSRK